MKSAAYFTTPLLVAILASSTITLQANEEPVHQRFNEKNKETARDLPTEYHRYYGQRLKLWKDHERRIAKVDLDADLNYDGTTSNSDPEDGGTFESTPPGLVLGEGELSKIILRVKPYRINFDQEVVLSLEVDGINREKSSGEFNTEAELQANTGTVRVWRDHTKQELLLDSSDPNRRYVEWTTQFKEYPYNVPQNYPRTVYVEGVKTSPKYQGDIRLLITCHHRKIGTTVKDYDSREKRALQGFKITLDHLLLTVQPEPHRKEFINNNIENIWIAPPQR